MSVIRYQQEPGGRRPYLDGQGIHCGSVIEILPPGAAEWLPVRVEYNWDRGIWYYIHQGKGGCKTGRLLIGLRARWPGGR